MSKDLKEFFEKCRDGAPEGYNFEYSSEKEITGADGEYALVREIGEDETDVYLQIMATGDLDGMQWLYDNACKHFEGFTGGIIETREFYTHGEKVDFH